MKNRKVTIKFTLTFMYQTHFYLLFRVKGYKKKMCFLPSQSS